MSQSMVTMLKDGQQYLDTWPVRKELFAYFPDCRVVSATRFAIKTMPPAAILACALLLQNMGISYIPQTIAIGAFFLSLPLQGLLWLGHRSNQQLPPALKQWYQEIHSKMRAQGCNVAAIKSQPRYRELAALLKTAFSDLDRVFTQQWFR
jgi:uncharacterized membrane protein YfbV (UPF0208 family)